MTEPDVALTDFAITAECALFTWLLLRGAPDSSAAMGALAGGTVHGFLLNNDSLAGAVLWRVALLALGLSAYAAWSIGGLILFAEGTARVIRRLAAVAGVAYAVVVLAVDQRFWIAIANYAPSVVFLGMGFLVVHRRTSHRAALPGLVGVVLTIAAAVVQRRQIALDPVHLDHNALYHLIQMTAFGLIFLAGRHLIAAPAVGGR
jgi:hypothetical protein